MPSPFPGMDPFIESQKWEDFHLSFIAAISDAIVAAVRPNYVVEIERRSFFETHSTMLDQSFIADAATMKARLEPVQQTEDSQGGLAGYDYAIDYREPVTPPLNEPESARLKSKLTS